MIINARGFKIEVQNDPTIVKSSGVFQKFLSTPMNNDNNEYYLNYRDKTVHKLIDYLEGYSENIKGLENTIDELLVITKNKKKTKEIFDKNIFYHDTLIDGDVLDFIFDKLLFGKNPEVLIVFKYKNASYTGTLDIMTICYFYDEYFNTRCVRRMFTHPDTCMIQISTNDKIQYQKI